MPSPICHCVSHGCGAQGGVTVELRTLKAHQRQDHAALALEARAARERVISAQEDEISAYLASMTLSDNVSGPPKRPGGHLWAREAPDTADAETLAAHLASASLNPQPPPSTLPSSPPPRHSFQPSRRTAIANLLQRLSGIESSAEQLEQEASAALLRLEYPTQNTYTSFPLERLLATCDSLLDDLSRVKSKAASVSETQSSIKGKVDSTRMRLVEARRKWKTCRNNVRESGPKAGGVPHNTGKY
jgi:hypothetical protein